MKRYYIKSTAVGIGRKAIHPMAMWQTEKSEENFVMGILADSFVCSLCSFYVNIYGFYEHIDANFMRVSSFFLTFIFFSLLLIYCGRLIFRVDFFFPVE